MREMKKHILYMSLCHPTLMNEGDEKHILYMSLCIHSFDYVIVCHFHPIRYVSDSTDKERYVSDSTSASYLFERGHPISKMKGAELFELLAPILPFSGCLSRLD